MTTTTQTPSDKQDPVQSDQSNSDAMQGEGDYKSAETYGKSVRAFVQSGKVEEAASKSEPETPQAEQALLKAEREGLSHSKGEDPASPRAPVRTSTDKP
jgi:hypothetical protein